MDAPNAPNPAIPNAQGNLDQNQDQGQDQDQVPAGQVPPPVPAQQVPQLAPIDNDWPALQNKFRWQYSKIGNTPEQLFHAWRTFKFDKNTDSVDSYVLRMSQVAAILHCGEM